MKYARNAADPFTKLRLVPIDDDVSAHAKLEKHIRNYNPTVEAMVKVHPHAYRRPNNKNYSSLAALAVQDAHRNHYKALQRNMDSTQSHGSANLDGILSLEDATGWDIPKQYAAKFRSLQEWLSGHRASVARTSQDELVLDGRVLRGTNYAAAFKGLYVNTKTPPNGTRELVLKLKQLGIPKSCISSRFALSFYGQAGLGLLSKRKYKRKQILRVY
jgi:hypothetical protein